MAVVTSDLQLFTRSLERDDLAFDLDFGVCHDGPSYVLLGRFDDVCQRYTMVDTVELTASDDTIGLAVIGRC